MEESKISWPVFDPTEIHNDVAVVTSYGIREAGNRFNLIGKYLKCMDETEGCECERNARILSALLHGKVNCHD